MVLGSRNFKNWVSPEGPKLPKLMVPKVPRLGIASMVLGRYLIRHLNFQVLREPSYLPTFCKANIEPGTGLFDGTSNWTLYGG